MSLDQGKIKEKRLGPQTVLPPAAGDALLISKGRIHKIGDFVNSLISIPERG
jgi:hypothetical protein